MRPFSPPKDVLNRRRRLHLPRPSRFRTHSMRDSRRSAGTSRWHQNIYTNGFGARKDSTARYERWKLLDTATHATYCDPERTHGQRTYLGIMMAGFPNLFLMTGPSERRRQKPDDPFLRAARRLDRRLPPISARGISPIDAALDAEDAWMRTTTRPRTVRAICRRTHGMLEPARQTPASSCRMPAASASIKRVR